MKNFILLITLILSAYSFADAGNPLYEGDIVALKVSEDIKVPSGKIEVRTSCGILINVEPRKNNRTIKVGKVITLEVTSLNRFWTRLERVEGTTTIKKMFLSAKTFEQTERLVKKCSELTLEKILPGEDY